MKNAVKYLFPTVTGEGSHPAAVGRRLEAPAEAVEGRLRVQIQGVVSDDSESAERVQFRNIGNRKHKSHLLKNRLCAQL